MLGLESAAGLCSGVSDSARPKTHLVADWAVAAFLVQLVAAGALAAIGGCVGGLPLIQAPVAGVAGGLLHRHAGASGYMLRAFLNDYMLKTLRFVATLRTSHKSASDTFRDPHWSSQLLHMLQLDLLLSSDLCKAL